MLITGRVVSLSRSVRDAPNLPAVDFGASQVPPFSDADRQLEDGLLLRTARILCNMKRLHTLTMTMWPTPLESITGYAEAFDPSRISFPSVKTLTLCAGMGWIIPVCPNVTSMSIYREPGNYRYIDEEAAHWLIDLAPEAPLLHHLEVYVQSTKILEHIAASLPRLTSLVMLLRVAIRDVAPVLSRFPMLTHLGVPRASELRIGFRPPRCGNYYMGKDGQARRQRVQQARREANREAANLAFSACATLKIVTIGDDAMATAERSEDGTLLDFTVAPVERSDPRPLRECSFSTAFLRS